MAKRKSRRLKRKIRNFFLLTIFIVISACLGWFLQRKENISTKEVIIDYQVIDTKKESKTNLVMVGDALIHELVYKTAARYANYNGYDFKPMLKYTKEILEDYDLAYYNQETILGGEELGLATYPQFNSPYEVGDAFIDAGFNLVSLATNHTMDNFSRTKGKSIENSVNYWKKHSDEILAAGSYTSFEERDQEIIKEINGIKYAFLSYTTYTNGLTVPKGREYLVNVYDKDLIKKEIERYRDKVDLLMVAMHWGTEYMTYPNEEQKNIASYLSSLGVDIIIGCHPHVIEPIEFVGNTLVIYSLGNFVSSQVGVERLTGLMASVDITKTEYHGKTTISFSNIQGTLLYTDRNNGYIVYPYHKLNDSILNGYKNYYEKYSKVVKAYSNDVTVRSLEG